MDVGRERLCNWIRYCADLLELRDWTIILSDEPPHLDDAHASIDPVYGRKIATVRLAPQLLDRHPTIIRQTIAHELVHLHVEGMHNVVDDSNLHDLLGKPAQTLLYEAFRLQMEHAVDALASVVAPTLPLFDPEREPVWTACELLVLGDETYIKPVPHA